MNNTLIDTFIEVTFEDPAQFLKIMETLSRIGLTSKDKKLWQSCHILHKQGKYYIVHFKELFLLDGKEADFTEEDKFRRNTIASLLQDWNLLKVKDPEKITDQLPAKSIKVIKYEDKKNWVLGSKYTVGKKRG